MTRLIEDRLIVLLDLALASYRAGDPHAALMILDEAVRLTETLPKSRQVYEELPTGSPEERLAKVREVLLAKREVE